MRTFFGMGIVIGGVIHLLGLGMLLLYLFGGQIEQYATAMQGIGLWILGTLIVAVCSVGYDVYER